MRGRATGLQGAILTDRKRAAVVISLPMGTLLVYWCIMVRVVLASTVQFNLYPVFKIISITGTAGKTEQ